MTLLLMLTASWSLEFNQITTTEVVFDELDYSYSAFDRSSQPRIVDYVEQDVCSEGRGQYFPPSTTQYPWNDSTDYALAWPGYFAPVRSSYTSKELSIPSFLLPRGKFTSVESYQMNEAGIRIYTRDDDDGSVKKIFRGYSKDLSVGYRIISVTRPEDDGGTGSGGA